MPDRVIRDELLRSYRYRTLSSDTARLLFVHILLTVDSLGNMEADTLSVGDALRRPVDDATAAKLLDELADADLIRLYPVGPKRYLHVPRFGQRMRYIKRVHPRPPASIEDPQINVLLKKVGLQSGASRTRTARREEKRSKNTTPSTASVEGHVADAFNAFWKAYPRRVGKQDAVKAWAKLNPDAELQAKILGALATQRQSAQWRRDNGKFVPYPATWLNGRRWEDEVPDAVPESPWGERVY